MTVHCYCYTNGTLKLGVMAYSRRRADHYICGKTRVDEQGLRFVGEGVPHDPRGWVGVMLSGTERAWKNRGGRDT